VDYALLAARQEGIVARWQLLDAGWTDAKVRWASRRWSSVHDGVWSTGHSTLSDEQLRWAARLTTRDSVISHASGGAYFGYYDEPRSFTVVTRPGTGGRERCAGLLVCHSTLLIGDVVQEPGRPRVTSATRTLLDLMGTIDFDDKRRRVVRDALRVGAVNPVAIEVICRRHRGRRGVARLRTYADEYAHLPATHTRSDAEVLGLAAIDGASVKRPEINRVVAGFEADLIWPDERVIVELDGPSFHFDSEDAKRDATWRRAGWAVYRVSTNVVYNDPARFLREVRAALAGANMENPLP